MRLQNKLVWGETVIDFVKPSWKRRYRFAKLGQSWKQSQPGGRRLLFVNIVSFKDLSIGAQFIVNRLVSPKGLVIKGSFAATKDRLIGVKV